MDTTTDYVPYTYLIGWKENDVWYYGCEYKSSANPKNLWVSYFTSSKYVKAYMKENGCPNVIEVRKTFKTKDEAINWEYKVLRRIKAKHSDRWLNRHDRPAPPVMNGANNFMYGNTHTPETRKILSEKRKGKPSWAKGRTKHTDKRIMAMSLKLVGHTNASGSNNAWFGVKGEKHPWFGRNHSDETKRKMSAAKEGKAHTTATKLKMREAKKGLYNGKFWCNDGSIERMVDSVPNGWVRGRLPGQKRTRRLGYN